MPTNAQSGAVRPELLAYEAALPQLLGAHAGQYVVIRGNDVLSFFDSYGAALAWAYDRFGLDPFFVKQVDADHSVAHYTRDLGP